MGANYVDDHRVMLGNRDITDFCSDLTLTDELGALSVELTFKVLMSNGTKYLPNLGLAPGNKIKVVNHETTVFSGQAVKVGLDGSVTAYDKGWYLNKSQIIMQCSNTSGTTVIKNVCSKAGVPAGNVCALPNITSEIWLGSTPSEIISDILDACSRATGKEYAFRVKNENLDVWELTRTPIKAYHKPASNLAAFNITWALGQVSGEDSAENLRNVVAIAAEDDGKVYIGALASNPASIEKYGFLQRIETVTEDPGDAQLKQQAKNLLNRYDRISYTRTISEIWGADEVQSGVVLSFNSPAYGISGLNRVTRVVHHYGGAGHVMELELQGLSGTVTAAGKEVIGERSVPNVADKVQVFGLPDDLGKEQETSQQATITGGKTVKAMFTAYYPADNALEGGFYDAMGNRLDPSKRTIAAPKSVPFGTKVTIKDTGTSRDGQTYTVTDRGGAITIKNGVYHFDILMGSNSECNNWGVRYGTAIIGGEVVYKSSTSGSLSSGASGTAAAFVAAAASQVGVKEDPPGSNKTNYGKWFGMNGKAWCAIFVCWCANKAGGPNIPHTASVSEMVNYFRSKGLYKSAASGYIPKAGDIMHNYGNHIGIVEWADSSAVHTIEGNTTNNDGNAIWVARKSRSYTYTTGFCTPWR